MDFSLLGVTIACLAMEVAFYFWHEPKIEKLEDKRKKCIKKKVHEFFQENSNMSNIMALEEKLTDYLHGIYKKDKNLIMSVGGITPHKKIFWMLILALISSFLYGLKIFHTNLPLIGDSINTYLDIEIKIHYIFLLIIIICVSISTYLAFLELKYILRIQNEFKDCSK